VHPGPRGLGVSVVVHTVREADEAVSIGYVSVLRVPSSPVPEGIMYVLQYGRCYHTNYEVCDEGQGILESGYEKRRQGVVRSESRNKNVADQH
jgi:hypothetical protein